jgi:hypothetical protein
MPEYTGIYAQNVSVYGSVVIIAEDDDEALKIARNIDVCEAEACSDICWDFPEQQRIVSIVSLIDEDDNCLGEDISLTEQDRPKVKA